MMLLPVAENAMKHGPLAGNKGPVRFAIIERGGVVTIIIENPGHYGGRREGGSGLPIVEKRLSLAYGDRAKLTIGAAGDDRCRAEIRIPSR